MILISFSKNSTLQTVLLSPSPHLISNELEASLNPLPHPRPFISASTIPALTALGKARAANKDNKNLGIKITYYL